jgi:hypothetical protein
LEKVPHNLDLKEEDMKYSLFVTILLAWSITALAEDSNFSTHLYPKLQSKACTNCHDFFEEKLNGLAFTTHKGRSVNSCAVCHKSKITGFEHSDEWFAQRGLYTSGMDPKETCEATKAAKHAQFKNKKMVKREMLKHLLEDPRVLWGIEGATPNSGNLPKGGKQEDLVKGGFEKWEEEVRAWIDGGMVCE